VTVIVTVFCLGFDMCLGFIARKDAARGQTHQAMEEAKDMFVSSYMQTMAYAVRCYMHATFKETTRYAIQKS
jgi:hypothetical protein